MTARVRRGVLLRLPPELLDRIDAAAGALDRTAFLIDAIERHLDALDGGDSLWEIEQKQWARQNAVDQGSPLPREEYGTPLPVDMVWETTAFSQDSPLGVKGSPDQPSIVPHSAGACEGPTTNQSGEQGSDSSLHQSSPGATGGSPSDQGSLVPGTAASGEQEGSDLSPKSSWDPHWMDWPE